MLPVHAIQSPLLPGKLPPRPWQLTRLAILLLPFSSFLGAVLLLPSLVILWRRNFTMILRDPLAWGLGAIALWLGITSCTAAYPLEALGGLANFLPYFAFFLGFKQLVRRWSHLRQLAWLLVLPALAIALLGLAQIFWGWDSGDGPRWIGFSLVGGGRPEGRLSSVFMYANLCAAYLLMVLPLALGLGIESWQQWQSTRKPQARTRGIALGLVIVGACISLLLTDSRNGWGILLGIGIAFALYLGWHYLVMAIATAAAAIFWAAWGPFGKSPLRQIVPAYFWARLSDEKFADRAVNALRTTQWKFVGEMAQQRPILGFGLRNFTPLYKNAQHLWLGHPHSLPLMLLGETGIPGLLMISIWVGWIIAQGTIRFHHLGRSRSATTQRNRLLLFSYLVAFGSVSAFNLFDVTVFELRINLLGWLLLAAIAGITDRHQTLVNTVLFPRQKY